VDRPSAAHALPVGESRDRVDPAILGRMPSSPEAASARNPRIDLLRGIAILLVILYHLNNSILFPGGYGLARGLDGSAHLPAGSFFLRFLLLPFHLGRVGVNLFFVISGLCIHMRFARQQVTTANPPFSPRTFFLRRFFRIYPVYWTALGVGVFVAPFAYKAAFPAGSPEIIGLPSLPDVAAHIFMLHSFFKPYMMSIIKSLWSIGTEEQFYLLYPIVFVFIGRRFALPKLVVGLLVVSMAWRLAFVLGNPPPRTFSDGPFLVWVFGFSVPRYFEWSLGALLAWAIANEKKLSFLLPGRAGGFIGTRPGLAVAAGIGFILVGAASLVRAQIKYLIEDPCYSTGWFLIAAATLLPLESGNRPSFGIRVTAIHSWAATRLQSLGRRSFSVYLLHEILLFSVAGLTQRFHVPVVVAALAGCGLIWGVCYPFYRYVEAPFELRSKLVGKRQLPPSLLVNVGSPT
jgi:peptidoglycan/LPS O-acetylase OafA/YrhL